MSRIIMNTNIIKKIYAFLKKSNSLKNLDPTIFETLDDYKKDNNFNFNDYYIEYISKLPKLDFENTIKISREIYQLYGKEKEFDKILESLLQNHNIDVGSLNKEDDNCITKATESRVLLSGTYYDVVLLCHEIGHKLRYESSLNTTDIADSVLFETPSILLEFAADDYLREHYGINIKAKELRQKHISSMKKENTVEKSICTIIIQLLKYRRLKFKDLYQEFVNNQAFMEYLNNQDTSIEDCIEEGMSEYSYEIGYILADYANNSNRKVELLNEFLKYKDEGITKPFTIEEKGQELVESQEYKK